MWGMRRHSHPLIVVGTYAVLTGAARFLVEFVRINDLAILGLTQPQLWSLALVAAGAVLLTVAGRHRRTTLKPPTPPARPGDRTRSPDPTASSRHLRREPPVSSPTTIYGRRT
jgi:phosphatidylglycerol:prolipoprotein diacylglycerol transferase